MDCPIGNKQCNSHGETVDIEGDAMCVQAVVCVVCKTKVGRLYGPRIAPYVVVCRSHGHYPIASPDWVRTQLQEAGDKWLEEYGGLQGMRDLPQPIWEAVEEWLV